MSIVRQQSSIGLGRFIAAVLLPLIIGLGLFYLTMNPPMSDFSAMMELMLFTTLISLVLAFAAYRWGWFTRLPRLQWSLLAVYVLAGVLVFLNVWIIARMMFASQHDLLLATILLVFATGIAAAVGFFLSAALTDRIVTLNRAAEQIARGELNTRVDVVGRDELAQLTRSFNAMAAQLELMQQKQQELDTLRRELVAWVSHDLRTPLTSMRAVLEALADGMVDDAETVQRYYRVAQQDIRSLSLLIDDLFDVSQIDAGGLQLDVAPNSIGDLISDTIERFSETARRQEVQLAGEVQPGTDPVKMDAPRIGRVLANLTSNALRHTPTGGQVHLSARRTPSGIEVEVRDTGEGIRPEDLPYVFDRFYRGEKSRSRATGGAGLGLAIARGIVEAHGGSIRVESEAGHGASFVFVLPE
ncbi:MAG TPA: ATP-binding protein [Anaerolineae bacterium]|nr:ATP-binding protein [Anaerolineae bacterium]